MALRAYNEKVTFIENRLNEICGRLSRNNYPEEHLPAIRLAFREYLNYPGKNAKDLLYSNKIMNSICSQIYGTEVPDENYLDGIGENFHRRSAKIIFKDEDYYGPLFKTGNYDDKKKARFLDFRSYSSKYRNIYNLTTDGVENASKDPQSPFMKYFINDIDDINNESTIKKHIDVIQLVLKDFRQKAHEYYWLPVANELSPKIEQTLASLSIKTDPHKYGIGLIFLPNIPLHNKKLHTNLSYLKKVLSPSEFHILCKGIFFSQNYPKSKEPILIMPRIKTASSIINKMRFKEEQYKHPIKLTELSDLTGACITGENYFFIENMMNCIKISGWSLVLEEENLFQVNKHYTPYRDVKYIITLNHPTMKNPSNHICFELQIKTTGSKIFHDLDHTALYKSSLSEENKAYIKRPLWGALWNREMYLLEEYEQTHKTYLKWLDKNFSDLI